MLSKEDVVEEVKGSIVPAGTPVSVELVGGAVAMSSVLVVDSVDEVAVVPARSVLEVEVAASLVEVLDARTRT